MVNVALCAVYTYVLALTSILRQNISIDRCSKWDRYKWVYFTGHLFVIQQANIF